MSDERKLILEMLKDGKISVEDAERLIGAMGNKTQPKPDTVQAPPVQVVSDPPKRVIVRVTQGGRNKVNVKIPFGLAKTSLKMGKSIGGLGLNLPNEDMATAMEILRNLDIDELLNSLNESELTLPYTLVDAHRAETGEDILVVLE